MCYCCALIFYVYKINELKKATKFMNAKKKIEELTEKALKLCNEPFRNIEKIAEINQQKMLKTFIDCKISERHLNFCSTGYGYEDMGRDALDAVYAKYFNAESALVRSSFVSGTHALAVALFGVLRPGDEILCITGEIYDTLRNVIGGFNNFRNEPSGSLKKFGINYSQLNLTKDGHINFYEIKNKINKNTKVVYIQKSRGYALRPAVTCGEIKKAVNIVKNIKKDCYVLVDNCYGEFTEELEPTVVGADLAVGSLIKNPGGGIARTGGYIVGKEKLVNLCAERLTAPGLGKEIGCNLNTNRDLFLGFFNAPCVVKEALKTAVFSSALFSLLSYDVFPKYDEYRADIVTAILLKNKENLIKFCETIQKNSPIDSFVSPVPWEMPGYNSEIIMACGAFISGSSIEISADAPLKEPFAAYFQGGTNFYSGKVAVKAAAEKMLKTNT